MFGVTSSSSWCCWSGVFTPSPVDLHVLNTTGTYLREGERWREREKREREREREREGEMEKSEREGEEAEWGREREREGEEGEKRQRDGEEGERGRRGLKHIYYLFLHLRGELYRHLCFSFPQLHLWQLSRPKLRVNFATTLFSPQTQHTTHIYIHTSGPKLRYYKCFWAIRENVCQENVKLRHFFTFTPVVCVFGDLCCDEKRSSPWRRRQCECGRGRERRTKRRCGDCRHGCERRGTRRRSQVDSQSPVRGD